MNTSCKSSVFPVSRPGERGNAMIYVLIAIVLFGALTMIVARQNENSETGSLDSERAGIAATQIIQTSMQLKQGVDQMLYGGTNPDNLDFVTPDTEPAFSVGPSHVNKVFHPSGGGLVLQALPVGAVDQISNSPPARWYIGRFNNVEWTPTTEQEVIMVAHQISAPVCQAINQILLGNPAPLITTANPRDILIDDQLHGGVNTDFTVAGCAACEGIVAACIQGPSEVPGETIRSFYSLILSR
ncbi:MAG: hypothetical protein NDJ24_05575 [Alphaproteobacteria bacterium]|nr:hypothetical protein [Alphaproteobacteria bacterium]